MASVDIQDVRKFYGQLETIKGVSVDVPDGAFVVLVGPSGCGKSTLLRMIAGLEDISGGTISIGGRVINDVEPKHRDIAMVFQNYALYPHMTIAENMGFSLRLAKRPKDEIDQRVREAAGILGLADYLDRYPRQLSGGQRQRVAMGRAIVRNPQVFLFDEPLSNLDAKLRVQMRAELKDIHARLKTTTVYVTHDQIEAMTMADRIVVMRDGLVEQVGAPLDLYDRPNNTFVASFIGSPSMNLLQGVNADGGKSVRIEAGAELPFEGAPPAVGKVVYGIRPEHLHLADDGQGFETVATNVEPTGSETLVQVRLGDQIVSALLRDRVNIRAGDTVRLGVQADKAHLFDAETSQRLG
ncbi:sn-glycerol-3-phosphate ABC transporter ATP-binding protein UgpC [Nitratireductor aquimarinus]|uniref:ABC transporter ATP-binding protein n=1 Tax=Nitratireductor TaxID=245876 RepID=UPI001A8CC27D|nr:MULTISPECIES: sn-glycerol-3-phosphate ABC transporter ATP-binding protein UgpC [Nitratireductor]MBN8243679.1 sn-glycerol-3-phosphate ABC transporter ATP-binding protein UgpC [Nitratireductor aquimarinus]MBY6132396.1 sn-glycerol-3-phosphate ABC transporter ATP-binding protein UgpC [Nitratireductor aquimarinus]MCA1303108.1 sn-glycerol-3-phosphate ABC transporter ATP-binding protein UgpC [Nitratireductor aquimarinus]MCV0378902.1 sn-glycerol-3-phosphate ABC transporter ATP-binding protein UgpC [